MTLLPLQRTSPWRAVRAAAAWHVSSQQLSRRNALVASTTLSQRRRELTEVESFLHDLAVRRSA